MLIDAKEACDTAIGTQDWALAEQAVRAEFDAKLRAELDRDAGATLHYFGAAPIPAAMLLGFLVGSWARVVPHLRHHESQDWLWPARVAGEQPPTLRKAHRPSGEPVLADGDVVVRVATSIAVDVQSTRDVVPKPLAETRIALEKLDLDALASADEVELVARQFDLFSMRSCRHTERQHDPCLRRRAGRSGVPDGYARQPDHAPDDADLLLRQEGHPRQIAAIALQTPRDVRAPITAEERQAAHAMREIWASGLRAGMDTHSCCRSELGGRG